MLTIGRTKLTNQILSEVLGLKTKSIYMESRMGDDIIAYKIVNGKNPSSGGYISFDDLSIKCREYIADKGFIEDISSSENTPEHHSGKVGKSWWGVLNCWLCSGTEVEALIKGCKLIMEYENERN